MGKQTNAFQRLCTYLQEQFHSPATVEESAFIPDKYTGERREIDVLVTVPVEGHTMTIGFECRDRTAVDDVTFVELTLCKHEATGINLSVLYSSSGFSEPARKKAHVFGMRLVKAEEGLKEDWPVWLRDLNTAYMAVISLAPSDVTVQTADGETAAPPAEMPLVDEYGQPIAGVDLKSVVHGFIQGQMPGLLKDAVPGTNGGGNFKIDLHTPIRIADTSGRIHEVVTLSGKLAWDAPSRIPVDLNHKRVEGIPVVYGEGFLDGRKAEFHWFAGPTGEKAIATLQIGKDKPQRTDMLRQERGSTDPE
jgi:hypothetical protein